MYSIYQETKEQIETSADIVKSATIQALVKEGLLDEKIGDEWAETHTVIMRKKHIFRTISDKFFKTDPCDKGEYYLIVKKIA